MKPNIEIRKFIVLTVLAMVAYGCDVRPAEEYVEDYLCIPDSLLGDGEHFILAVRGESMINAGIMDGDYVIIRRQNEVMNGEIAVAIIDGEATLKRYYHEQHGIVRLQPENSTMAPILVKQDDVAVLGKACVIYRKLD